MSNVCIIAENENILHNNSNFDIELWLWNTIKVV